MVKDEGSRPGVEGQRTLPWREVPKYVPWVPPESARTISFNQFQKEKFQALFDPNRALQWRKEQEQVYFSWYR